MNAAEIATRQSMLAAIKAAFNKTKDDTNVANAGLSAAVNAGAAELLPIKESAINVVAALTEYAPKITAAVTAAGALVPDVVIPPPPPPPPPPVGESAQGAVYIYNLNDTKVGKPIVDSEGHVWDFGMNSWNWPGSRRVLRDGVPVPDVTLANQAAGGWANVLVYWNHKVYGNMQYHDHIWTVWNGNNFELSPVGDPRVLAATNTRIGRDYDSIDQASQEANPGDVIEIAETPSALPFRILKALTFRPKSGKRWSIAAGSQYSDYEIFGADKGKIYISTAFHSGPGPMLVKIEGPATIEGWISANSIQSGIWFEGADLYGIDLRLSDLLVTRHTNGTLGGIGLGMKSRVEETRCKWQHHGGGDGQTHGNYWPQVAEILHTNCYYLEVAEGHLSKGRQRIAVYDRCSFLMRLSSASACIDAAHGGLLVVTNSVFCKGPNSGNSTAFIFHGRESSKRNLAANFNAVDGLKFNKNLVVNLFNNGNMTAEDWFSLWVDKRMIEAGLPDRMPASRVDISGNDFCGYQMEKIVAAYPNNNFLRLDQVEEYLDPQGEVNYRRKLTAPDPDPPPPPPPPPQISIVPPAADAIIAGKTVQFKATGTAPFSWTVDFIGDGLEAFPFSGENISVSIPAVATRIDAKLTSANATLGPVSYLVKPATTTPPPPPPPPIPTTTFPQHRKGKPKDKFYPLPNTAPSKFNLNPAWGTAWTSDIIKAWNGLHIDRKRSKIYSAKAGGHAANEQSGVYMGPEVMSDDPAKLVWSVVRPSQNFGGTNLPKNQNVAHFPDSPYDPTSDHTYSDIWCIDIDNKPFLISVANSAPTYIASAPESTDAFDVLKKEWALRGGDWQKPPFWAAPGLSVCPDWRDNSIYVIGSSPGMLFRLDTKTRKWTQLTGWINNWEFYGISMRVDEKRNRIVTTGSYSHPDRDPGWAYGTLEMGNYAFANHALSGNNLASIRLAAAGLVVDPFNDRYLQMCYDGVLCSVDPVTYKSTKLLETTPGVNGVYNRFELIPALQACVYQADWDTDLQILPLT